jgi:hypothetical protein
MVNLGAKIPRTTKSHLNDLIAHKNANLRLDMDVLIWGVDAPYPADVRGGMK